MMIKASYPNYSEYMSTSTVYNLERWTGALREIYVKVRLGLPKEAATETITGSWPKIERHNFRNWMKYYESGEQSKYKTAQSNSYYTNEEANYFLPNPQNRRPVPSPISSLNDIAHDAEQIATRVKPGLSKEEEMQANDAFRRKLISRLNSLEKHLGSHEGYLFAGKEYSNFLQSLYELKKKIQTHGKMSLSTQTCIDLLIKEANILQRKNCPIASDVMVKLAQQLPGNNGQLPMGDLPAGGSIPQGLGNLGAPTPEMGIPPEKAVEEPSAGIDGFLENLEGGSITDTEELSLEDNVTIEEDTVEVDPLNYSDGELFVEAQLAPEPAPGAKPSPSAKGKLPPQQKIKPQPINDETDPTEDSGMSDFDTLVNSAFDKLKMEDLLKKLQDISLIFKKKEINKQLALADLMMSKLQLTPYFPNFSEIQQKQLDATNYSLTRMNEIISTIQGSVGKQNIDLTKQEDQTDPEVQLLKRHLENEETKEKDRKQARKDIEQQKLNVNNNTDKEELEIESPATELAEAPAKVEAPAVPPAKPPVAQRG